MGGTDSIDIVDDSDYDAHIVVVVDIEAGTSSDTDWAGTRQYSTILAPVQPAPSPHSSSSMCRLSFPSRVGMLYNPSLHAPLTYKIYKKFLQGYLQSFASIGTLHCDSL